MQFFNEQEDVFLQELPDEIFNMDKEIFSVGREVKKRLGDDGYLLDNYLAMILEAVNGNTIQQAFDDSENSFNEVSRLCLKIREGKDIYDEDIQKRRLYPEVKKYIELYSAKYKSPYTAMALTCISVTPIVMRKLYAEGIVVYSSRGRIDTVRLKELYDQMCTYAGEKLLDRLNELVKTRFIIAPALNVYMQAATDELLFSLLQRDEVTSKQLFQLVLDDVAVDSGI